MQFCELAGCPAVTGCSQLVLLVSFHWQCWGKFWWGGWGWIWWTGSATSYSFTGKGRIFTQYSLLRFIPFVLPVPRLKEIIYICIVFLYFIVFGWTLQRDRTTRCLVLALGVCYFTRLEDRTREAYVHYIAPKIKEMIGVPDVDAVEFFNEELES